MKVKGCIARKVSKDMLFKTVVVGSVIPGCHNSDLGISFFQIFCEITEIFNQCEEQLILFNGGNYFSYKSMGSVFLTIPLGISIE